MGVSVYGCLCGVCVGLCVWVTVNVLCFMFLECFLLYCHESTQQRALMKGFRCAEGAEGRLCTGAV